MPGKGDLMRAVDRPTQATAQLPDLASMAGKRGQRRSAERQRRWRSRQRQGAAVLRIEVTNYFRLITALLHAGWLSEHQSADRRQVEAAVSAAINGLADWTSKKV
jgi:hypothetical protein